jgi:uncharacterized RDD family membrane protein YckC
VTSADGPQAAGTPYPWHQAGSSVVVAAQAPSAVTGSRAGLVTRSLANIADLFVVATGVVGGYLAVAAARFLLGPATFSFPVASFGTLLVVGLCVQALYFTVTWAVVGGTYGDRLLSLRVCDDRGARLRWGRCAVRAVLCTVFPIGLLWVLVSQENRSVQDIVLSTSVTYG